jgi:DeoR/GlpR family transcriptional regulator of sugar metabolism
MTKEERHQLILETLIKQESAQVSDLAALLEVSAVTIRKDLTELEGDNKLYRSHGKAILINPYINNRSVNEKEKLATEEKNNIGKRAAELITKDDSIIIASGTTVHALARNIKPINKLTVVSASLQVSEILANNEAIDIIQLGGTLRHSSNSVVGKYAEQILSSFSCSKLFLGVDGIDVDFGLTTTDMREADLNKEMMRTAQKTIVLADSSKFRRRGFSKIANIEDVDVIITDSGISKALAQRIEEIGVELIIVQ